MLAQIRQCLVCLRIPFSVKYLRILRQFFGVKFKIVCDTDAESQSESVLLSCQGIGFVNFARKIF